MALASRGGPARGARGAFLRRQDQRVRGSAAAIASPSAAAEARLPQRGFERRPDYITSRMSRPNMVISGLVSA